jgi:hypothetical protein
MSFFSFLLFPFTILLFRRSYSLHCLLLFRTPSFEAFNISPTTDFLNHASNYDTTYTTTYFPLCHLFDILLLLLLVGAILSPSSSPCRIHTAAHVHWFQMFQLSHILHLVESTPRHTSIGSKCSNCPTSFSFPSLPSCPRSSILDHSPSVVRRCNSASIAATLSIRCRSEASR